MQRWDKRKRKPAKKKRFVPNLSIASLLASSHGSLRRRLSRFCCAFSSPLPRSASSAGGSGWSWWRHLQWPRRIVSHLNPLAQAPPPSLPSTVAPPASLLSLVPPPPPALAQPQLHALLCCPSAPSIAPSNRRSTRQRLLPGSATDGHQRRRPNPYEGKPGS